MDYNSHYNQNFGQMNVPPYPTSNSNRTSSTIIENKDKELSFVNSVLKNLKGKEATYYFSYSDSIKWRDMEYKGSLIGIGEDYIVIKESLTGNKLILLLLYLEWVVYEGEEMKLD